MMEILGVILAAAILGCMILGNSVRIHHEQLDFAKQHFMERCVAQQKGYVDCQKSWERELKP